MLPPYRPAGAEIFLRFQHSYSMRSHPLDCTPLLQRSYLQVTSPGLAGGALPQYFRKAENGSRSRVSCPHACVQDIRHVLPKQQKQE